MDYILSVVIPIYNGEEFLRESVSSVLNQPNTIELILVNDGSSDSSLEICNSFSDYNNVVVIDKPNGGVGTARNVGLKSANGKYIMFLDQDDILFYNFFDKSVVELLQSEKVDVFAFSYDCTNSDFSRYKSVIVADKKLTGPGNLMPSWNHHSSFIINRELLLDNGIKYTETRFDGDEQFRFKFLMCAKSILFINRRMFKYRRNISSETHSKVNQIDKMLPIIESWSHIKENTRLKSLCRSEKSYCDLCDVIIYFQILNLIKYLSMDGYKSKHILSIVNDIEEYDSFCKCYTTSQVSEKHKKLIKLWITSPNIFTSIYCFIGVLIRVSRVLLKNELFSKLYDCIKYPDKY